VVLGFVAYVDPLVVWGLLYSFTEGTEKGVASEVVLYLLSYERGDAGGKSPVKKRESPGGWGPFTMMSLMCLLIAS